MLSENERIVSDLTEARKLLEKGWTQSAYARNANGVAVDEENPNACSFCVRGALTFACHSWAVTARGIRQRNIPIRTGDDQERETVGQIEERWVVQAIYDRVRMAGQGGAVIEV